MIAFAELSTWRHEKYDKNPALVNFTMATATLYEADMEIGGHPQALGPAQNG